MLKDPKYQGVFHLLIIFFLPALLVAFFLSESWIPVIIVLTLFISAGLFIKQLKR